MILDVHNHVGLDVDKAKQTISKLKVGMRNGGVDKAVIFPFNEKGNLIGISVKLLEYRSSSIIPFLRFDPKTTSADEVEGLLCSYPFAGVKLHTRNQNFDPLDKRFSGIFKKIQECDKPVLLHTRAEKIKNSDPDRAVKLADRFKTLDIIIGHFAGALPSAFEQIKKHDNLYAETSIFCSPYLIRTVSEWIGVEKLLFGSDTPYSDQQIEMMKITKSGLPKSDQARILYSNGASLILHR